MHKNEYRPPDRSRKQRFLTQEEIENGKKGKWTELEITGKNLKFLKKFKFGFLGPVRALSPALWNLRHLTALYLNDNHLTRLPPEVSENFTVQKLIFDRFRCLQIFFISI